MPGKSHKKKTDTSEPESPDKATVRLDQPFVASDNPRKGLRGLKKLSGKQWLIAVVVLVLIAGGVAAFWYFGRKSATDKQNQDFQALMSSVKDLRNQGKDGEAQAKLLEFYDHHPHQTKDQRYLIATELGAIFKTAGNYKKAVEWQRIAVDNNPDSTFGDYFTLGEAYALDKDNANAIKYFQLALDKLKQGDAGSDGGPQGRFIKNQIERLQQEGQ